MRIIIFVLLSLAISIVAGGERYQIVHSMRDSATEVGTKDLSLLFYLLIMYEFYFVHLSMLKVENILAVIIERSSCIRYIFTNALKQCLVIKMSGRRLCANKMFY